VAKVLEAPVVAKPEADPEWTLSGDPLVTAPAQISARPELGVASCVLRLDFRKGPHALLNRQAEAGQQMAGALAWAEANFVDSNEPFRKYREHLQRIAKVRSELAELNAAVNRLTEEINLALLAGQDPQDAEGRRRAHLTSALEKTDRLSDLEKLTPKLRQQAVDAYQATMQAAFQSEKTAAARAFVDEHKAFTRALAPLLERFLDVQRKFYATQGKRLEDFGRRTMPEPALPAPA